MRNRDTMTVWRAFLPDLLTACGLIAAPFILPSLGFAADTVNRILVLGLFGIGFDILFGFTGLLSFGQSAFFGTGGFVAAYLTINGIIPNVMLALVIGTIVGAATGVLVGLIALRRTGIYFAMITVAIAETFFFVENSPLAAYTGGENGLSGVPSPVFNLGFVTWRVGTGYSMYTFLAICFLVGMIIARRIIHSPVGAIFMAIRDNPIRARAVGHAVERYKLLAFTIAAAYAGLAGGLLGVLQGYMPPDAFTFDTSGELIMQTMIGGTGFLFGPLAGAAVWLYLRDFLQSGLGLGAAWKLVLGIIFVLLICFLRRGVIGGVIDLVGLARPRRSSAPTDEEPLPADAPPKKRPAPPPGPVLEVRGLSRRFGGLVANNDIDFTVEAGELRGVIGPNGAGKSTFFKMITCEMAPTAGTIRFQGRDITGWDVTDVCQIGLTKSYQVNQLFTKLTVRQNLAISALAAARGRFRLDVLRRATHVPGVTAQIAHTLALIGLTGRADVAVSDLAYGEKRRVEIGLALASEPTLLLLDEPLAGMSPQERAETVQLLRRIRVGRTLIVVEHDMDAIFGLAERITVLCEGRVLADGTPLEIQASKAVQDAYLGGEVVE
ncbi:ABC transporter permease subunit [Acidisphaera sp. S103]|uniref:branched-chain amino acid ABC transporter ATP-binding protein/permease n=1 Tax=Acidisphaera sp. S103 TaxID=1747223 RepID=UPI001C202593|nr:branched-chain amino acid ABC transporter ATP-binding protein/permease [Acidisphaera sp. S103]